MSKLLTEIEVSDLTRVSRSKLRQDRMSGIGIPFVKIGDRVLYRESDVIEFVDRHTFRSTSEANRCAMVAA